MLGSAVPATATLHTTTSSATPTSPTRPSRLRGLSYLRSYTHNHLSSSNRSAPPNLAESTAPALTRSTSSPGITTPPREQQAHARGETIQNGEHGWLPTVQGRSGLSRDSLNPTSSTASASPERTSSGGVGMTRNRALGPTQAPATASRAARRQSSAGEMDENNYTTTRPTPEGSTTSSKKDPTLPTIRFIPHVEARSPRPSLTFTAISRTLKQPNSIVRVGRYSERDNVTSPTSSSGSSVTPVGFKSKVVSRRHCEFWCTPESGQWFVKDVKSSSGTFLNHVRLSSPGVESRPYPVNDGDLVQLGIDFKGGEEVIFRCVKIRIECNRGWQKRVNSFNTSAHNRLLNNTRPNKKPRDSDAASTTSSSECSICLNPVAPCQALFVAPCSHVWHYKCVRNLIQGPAWPNFLCPNCRFVADLEADVEPAEEPEIEDSGEVIPEEEGEGDGDGGVGVQFPDESEEHEEAEAEDDDMDSAPSREPHDPSASDYDLTSLINTTNSLQLDQIHHNHSEIPPTQLPSRSQNSTSTSSRPLTISQSNFDRRPSSSTEALDPIRSMTPTTNTQFALAAGLVEERDRGPMTPRNDVGPFVLDGGHGED